MIGPVLPQHWSTKQLKYLATYNDEALAESTDDEKEIEYVEISDVSLSGGIEAVECLSFGEAPSRARRRVRSGDILISTVRTYLRAIARVDEAAPNLIASTGFCVVRPTDDVDSGFLGWAAQSESFVSEVVARSVGVSYPAISPSELVNIEIPVPPLDTQRQIARSLDERMARIKRLVSKKQELLSRLAEKRTALITMAVTKGLSFGYPLKGSDIGPRFGELPIAEGTGEITELVLPQDWASKRLKHLATYNDEVLAENTDDEEEIDYVEISGVSLSDGIKEIERITFSQAPSRARRRVRSGDILISTVRTYLRAIARVDEATPNLIASTGFCVVRPSDNVDGGFLGWAVKSEPFVSEVVARSVGVGYPAINASDIVTIEIALPPLDTQRQIAIFLNEKTTQIDRLSERVRESIELLEEYKSAQIDAAITGHITELL